MTIEVEGPSNLAALWSAARSPLIAASCSVSAGITCCGPTRPLFAAPVDDLVDGRPSPVRDKGCPAPTAGDSFVTVRPDLGFAFRTSRKGT
jgi:hypothetical protein